MVCMLDLHKSCYLHVYLLGKGRGGGGGGYLSRAQFFEWQITLSDGCEN